MDQIYNQRLKTSNNRSEICLRNTSILFHMLSTRITSSTVKYKIKQKSLDINGEISCSFRNRRKKTHIKC